MHSEFLARLLAALVWGAVLLVGAVLFRFSLELLMMLGVAMSSIVLGLVIGLWVGIKNTTKAYDAQTPEPKPKRKRTADPGLVYWISAQPTADYYPSALDGSRAKEIEDWYNNLSKGKWK